VETNNLKTVSTMRFSDVRQAYDHFAEHRKLIASYCGTGNNIQFLNDPSGNRRWLPFEVESITSPRDVPFDYAAIYSQSYALYREGYEYYFSEVENDFINERNKERFSIPDPEAELVEEYFRKPTDKNPGIFVTSSDAADIVSTASRHIKPAAIGRALSRLGFESDRKGNRRGYYVVIVDYDERKREAASLAYDAMLRRSKANSPSDKPKTADTSNMPDAF
jgi:predicted P-loop ATPase